MVSCFNADHATARLFIMSIKGYGRFSVFLALLMCLVSCSVSHGDSHHAVGMCGQLWSNRYSNVSLYDSIAGTLAAVDERDNELCAIAGNASGYAAMMRMDYAEACSLYMRVLENSDCEIERLAADVGLMTVCYRVSENRSFFDYRTDALSRIKRINEEFDLLSSGDRMRFMRAKIEFGIVSVCYFSNLCMQDEKSKALQYLRNDLKHVDDVALRLYADMILANNVPNQAERLQRLCEGALDAKENGYVWLEANYNLLLTIGLRDTLVLCDFKEQFPLLYSGLNADSLNDFEFLSVLAQKSVDGFKDYGDCYMMIEALVVSASCNIEYGRYEEALHFIDAALGHVNEYYSVYYPMRSDLCVNSLDDYREGVYGGSVQDEGVYNIPECMLSVRREACCAFAGLGDIYASDINRNAYLELLETTRMNKHLESRVSHVEEDSAELDYLLVVIIVLLVIAACYMVFMASKRRRYELFYSASLKQLHKACRTLLASLPREVDSKEELCAAVSAILNDCLGDFSGKTRFFVAYKPDAEIQLSNRYEFSLLYLDGKSDDTLYVEAEYLLNKEKKSVLEMVVSYVAVAIEEGLLLADICDECMRAEEEHKAYSIYLAEHKRENLLKRVSLSVVGGMRPYMDRISGEVKALAGGCEADDALRKLRYISELASKLDDFNHILERWIKMRQGELSLQIEKFSLKDVFAIVAKSGALLEKRGVELEVRSCDVTVKADKALTLFMVNTLVDNAAKFTPAGGKVVLESIEFDDCVEIAVTDTGIGISQVDIDRILGEKVYDASSIGRDNEQLLAKKKGGGFGLMNCKGIIEKYRKSGEQFSVCSMDIKSDKGKGSRFSFRLPKGILRGVLIVLMMLPLLSVAQNSLDMVSNYADSVYYCNVEGDYEKAFVYAGQALDQLNEYYRTHAGGTDTLSLDSGAANEIKWWREELFADSLKEEVYFNILDIRNEVAVASLATKRWRTHRYNNYIYTTLYRMTHEDKGISERYTAMRAALNYRMAAVALLMFILLSFVLYIVVSYVRHDMIHRRNENMLLRANRKVLQVATGNRRIEAPDLLGGIVNEIFGCMGESMRLSRIAIMLRQESAARPVVAEVGEKPNRSDNIFMLGVIDSGERFLSSDGMTCVLPLFVNSADERILAGAIEFVALRPLTEDELLSLELVASYTASVAYHALVRVASSYMALEEAEEQIERIKYEENRLHVQNMVLDNCLSALKHETVYYPSRIRNVAEQAVAGAEEKDTAVASIAELMDYYSSIFGILSNCAKRELDDRCFAVSKVGMQQLFESAVAYAARLRKKTGKDIVLSFEATSLAACVDVDLVEYLFESLIDAAFRIDVPGVLQLRAADTGSEVRVELVDNRYELTSDEIADLFVPTRRNIAPDGKIQCMEYLVAKEIVRLHEDNTGHRGSRMEARSDVAGTVILFTLPKSLK